MINEMWEFFDLKENFIGTHYIYLGINIHEVNLKTGVNSWGFGCAQYIKAAVNDVEEYLQKKE